MIGPVDQSGREGPGLARTWRVHFAGESEPVELTGWEQLDFTEPVAHSPSERLARAIAQALGWEVESLPPTRR